MKSLAIRDIRESGKPIKREEPGRADKIFRDILVGMWESVSCSGGESLDPNSCYCGTETTWKGEEAEIWIHSKILEYSNTFERFGQFHPEKTIAALCLVFRHWGWLDTADIVYLNTIVQA